MDHVVYLDAKAKEFDKLHRGVKTTIIRGATGPKMPYNKVFAGDVLYFIDDNGGGALKGKAVVKSVFNSPKMTKEESIALVEAHKDVLRLSATQERRWAGKRYLVLVEIEDFERIPKMVIDVAENAHFEDWLAIGDIHNILMI